MKVIRILTSKNLNHVKYQQLEEQAQRLGQIRTEIWHRYGSIHGVGLTSDRIIRDQWLKENARLTFLLINFNNFWFL